jgi:polyferredoxin
MRLKSYRLLLQVIFLFLSIIGLLGISSTGLIFPYFFCNASPAAAAVCPLWAIEHASILTQLDPKAAVSMFLFTFGFLGVIGFMVGRSFCGWACPIGFIQDISKHFRGKFKIQTKILYGLFIGGWIMVLLSFLLPHLFTGFLGTAGIVLIALALFTILSRLDNSVITSALAVIFLIVLILSWIFLEGFHGTREIVFFFMMVLLFMSVFTLLYKFVISKQKVIEDTKYYHQNHYYKIKYVILVLIPITSFIFLDKWFTNIDPIGALTAGLPVLMAEADKWNISNLLWLKFILLILFFWLILITTHGFCRVVCPVGALMAPTNKISLQNIKYYPENCTSCMKCQKVCPMRIDIFKMKRNMECTRCARCVDSCKDNALHMTMANKIMR